MPFVKLDCDILDSSLWLFDPERILFLTALCMAVPMEVDKPLRQIPVGSEELNDDFTVPPGWYGFVRASPLALIQRARVAENKERIDAAIEALIALGDIDPDSRSKDFDGRRLVRVDGGFIVLNLMKHRDHDYKNAERQRRWRQREKERKLKPKRNVTNNGNNGVTVTPVTQADADAEVRDQKEEQKQKPTRKLAADANTIPLPLFLDTKEFRIALGHWVDHKKLKRDPLTQHALDLIVKDCEKWGPEKSIHNIEESIKGGWKGIHEPNQQYQPKQKSKSVL